VVASSISGESTVRWAFVLVDIWPAVAASITTGIQPAVWLRRCARSVAR